MLYAAEKMIEAAFSVSAVNTQITALNTAFSITATALAVRVNGLVRAPKDAGDFPALVYFVGQDPAPWRLREFGKRDTVVPVRLLYISRHTTMESAKTDIQIALEAMQPIIETLPSTQYGSTLRYSCDIHDPVAEFVTYKVSEEVIRHGGEHRFTMLMRTEG